MTRVLLHATHHPRPEHLDDLLGAMGRIAAAAPGVAGLEEIGAFADAAGGRVLAISVWSSAEAMRAGMDQLFAGMGDVSFEQWERRPRELLVLPEAVPPAPVAGGRDETHVSGGHPEAGPAG